MEKLSNYYRNMMAAHQTEIKQDGFNKELQTLKQEWGENLKKLVLCLLLQKTGS